MEYSLAVVLWASLIETIRHRVAAWELLESSHWAWGFGFVEKEAARFRVE